MLHSILRFSTYGTYFLLPVSQVQRFINDWNNKLKYILQFFPGFNYIPFLYTVWCKNVIVHIFTHKELIYEPGKECPEAVFGNLVYA